MRLALGLFLFTHLASAAEISILQRKSTGIGNRSSICNVIAEGNDLHFKSVRDFGAFQIADSQTVAVSKGLTNVLATLATQKPQRKISFAPNSNHTVYSVINSAGDGWVTFSENKPGEDIFVNTDEAHAMKSLIDSYCR